MGDEQIRFECSCSQPMRAPRELAGRKARCRRCGRTIVIPEMSTRLPTPPEAKRPPLQPVVYPTFELPPEPPSAQQPPPLRTPPPLNAEPSSPPRPTQRQKTLRILKRSAMRNLPAVLCLLCMILFLGYRLVEQVSGPQPGVEIPKGFLACDDAVAALADAPERPFFYRQALEISRHSLERMKVLPYAYAFSRPGVYQYTTKDYKYWLVTGQINKPQPDGHLFAMIWSIRADDWICMDCIVDGKVITRAEGWTQFEFSLPGRTTWPALIDADSPW